MQDDEDKIYIAQATVMLPYPSKETKSPIPFTRSHFYYTIQRLQFMCLVCPIVLTGMEVGKKSRQTEKVATLNYARQHRNLVADAR